jgi:hypothetical protein
LFDLTTDDTAIYHPQRWDGAKSVPSTLIQHAYQKTKFLSFQEKVNADDYGQRAAEIAPIAAVNLSDIFLIEKRFK